MKSSRVGVRSSPFAQRFWTTFGQAGSGRAPISGPGVEPYSLVLYYSRPTFEKS